MNFSSIIFNSSFYYGLAWSMLGLAFVVFIVLNRISAGYGMMYTKKWGLSVPNRIGWVLMEIPAFATMILLWLASERKCEVAPVVMASYFLAHYFQRTFIFPFLIRGRNRMPWVIILCGIVFNTINSYLIGGWLFFVSPREYYPVSWLWSPLFILGSVMFFAGMVINLHSDNIVRHLRKPGDTGHYIPMGGMFRYVSSANYFGEFVEWVGYAILTWSLGGLVFAVWTFANLAPRALKIHKRYSEEFGEEFKKLNRKRILPFIY